jgi:endonuclease/exonuclease/phosphatase (EEP) superfamily protein YafD
VLYRLITLCVALILGGCIAASGKPQLVGSHGHALDAAGCAANPDATTSIALAREGFSLASWNIYKQQRAGWAGDLDQLSRQSDILVLQEASLRPELRGWLGDRELAWDMTPAFSYQGVPHGVMTVARSAALQNCSHLQQEPWLRVPKSVLASYYPIEGSSEQLLVVNIHAVNFTFGVEPLNAQFQAAASLIASHTGPVILAGDFNTWSDARMEVLTAVAEAGQLQSIRFDGQQPAAHLGRTVDHIYYRGLTVVGSEVMLVSSSDHYPLRVQFEFQDAAI